MSGQDKLVLAMHVPFPAMHEAPAIIRSTARQANHRLRAAVSRPRNQAAPPPSPAFLTGGAGTFFAAGACCRTSKIMRTRRGAAAFGF